MNEVRVKRMLLAGLAMFVMWVAAEFLVEQVLGRLLFGSFIQERSLQLPNVNDWLALNQVVNILVALLNCTLLIWLYAALRPMYGVGTKTALIASAFGVVFLASLTVNLVNLGLIPRQIGLMEAAFVTIELPIAMLVGASVYEGAEKKAG